MHLRRQLRWVVIVLFAAVLTMTALPHSQAQTTDQTVTLGVSPQILELSVNPGETQTSTFRLTNASNESIDVVATPENFTPRGEEGAIDLTEDRTTYSLASWLTPSPAKATIAATKTQDFVVTIAVPAGAEPGSHFGSVVFRTIPPEDKTANALVSQEIAPVILVRVAGDVTQSAEIVSFKPEKSFYSTETSINLEARIKNTSSVHFKPTGKIVVKNMFGNEVAALGMEKKNVLPDSIRQITTVWNPGKFAIGTYHATLTVVTGENNKIDTVETTIVIFPFQVIIPVIAGLTLLGYLLYRGRSRLSNAFSALRGKQPPER